jgi:hypothetical protein
MTIVAIEDELSASRTGKQIKEKEEGRRGRGGKEGKRVRGLVEALRDWMCEKADEGYW